MADTRVTIYKRYNGTDWDTHYFKAPASVISETATRKWLLPTDKARIDNYLVADDFNKAFKLLQLDGNATIPVNLIPGGLNYVPITGGVMTGGLTNNVHLDTPLLLLQLRNEDSLYIREHPDDNNMMQFGANGDASFFSVDSGLFRLENNQRITGLGVPVGANDAVNKSYVDQLVSQGTTPIEAVRVATTQNITLSGLGAIDGVTLVAGNRVLVRNQTTASENGIYTSNSSTWTKVTSDSKKGSLVSVTAGTVNKGHQFYAKTETNWIEYYVYDDYTGGSGITISGMTISIGTGAITNTMLAGSIEESKLGAISQSKISKFASNENVTPSGANIQRTIDDHFINLYSMIKQVKGTSASNGAIDYNLTELGNLYDNLDLGNKTYEGSASPSNSGYKTGDVYLQFDA